MNPAHATGAPGTPPLPLSASCPVPLTPMSEVTLAHGSGGKLTHQLIDTLIRPAFANPLLDPMHDGAVFTVDGARLAFTTDSFVVDPLFFPGGDIGTLAVNGTINDLAMCGAKPLYLSAAFIIEEGLPMDELRRVVQSMKAAANAADVFLVTGDTKVVNRGKGDKVIVSGPIAVHGMAIMSVREGLEFETEIASDTAPLHGLVEAALAADPDIHVLRDPTRGGISSTLVEIAESAHIGIWIDETRIPINEDVKGACELLGLDPLYVANEGKLIAVVRPESSGKVLAALRGHPIGAGAAIIGEVVDDHHGMVIMRTKVGGERVVDMLPGEQLPRIC